ncbi:CDP-glycerol glycerophosphotransferase family protein [Niallia nealsonii]|uniref:CDP-glycerol:poly(Glycerophosphate) glycerophosphotransferase n=1 Tax=Niallia nealsonii TaxID=115979 RepID=A0A2N0Z2H0_9BACI|nr:CDP-glycerol glycerophosphotransferase family protein [Niallia nealsonii]PKG23706.1 hypothetical protein CWS01_10205 [Niallia nealsonii]
MGKSIIFFENLNNGQEIYNYMVEKNLELKGNLIYLDSNPSKFYKSKWYRIYDKINKILKIGIVNTISYFITKKTIIISGSSGAYQKNLSNNIILLNHGWGTKSTPGKNELNNPDIMKNYENTLANLKYIICLSSFDSTYYLNNEKLNSSSKPTFIPLGSPRNDYLVRNINNNTLIQNIEKELKINKTGKKIFLYSPTHRDDKIRSKEFLNELLIQFNQIDKELEKKNYIILFRPHYYSPDIQKEIEKFNNILYVGFDKYKDVRPLMLLSDLLITDYSSIFVDYLLINKPIIFHVPDLEEYSNFRGLVIDYENLLHTPGPKIKKLKDLFLINELSLSQYDLKASKHFFHKYTDDRATERISKFIKREFQNL